MMIIGCDLHTRYQQIAMLDTPAASPADSAATTSVEFARAVGTRLSFRTI